MLEEVEKCDYCKFGCEMDLFYFQEEGLGVVFWYLKGWDMFQNLIVYKCCVFREDYDEVNVLQVFYIFFWEMLGYWGWYQENMFVV